MRFRPRFSLRTFFLVVTAVCFAVGLYVFGKRYIEIQREVRKLRSEVGYLTIDDPSKVHVLAIDTGEPDTWRWRIFIPQGHRYSWHIAAENIPRDDVPKTGGTSGVSNEPYWEHDNEVLATARLRRVDANQWRLSIESRIGDSKDQMFGTSLQIPDDKLQWMATVSSTDGRVAGNSGAQIFDPAGPIILLQRRPCEQQPDGNYAPSPNPMPGFMIWLKKEK